MAEHDKARRSFLLKSAASVGAIAGAAGGTSEANARQAPSKAGHIAPALQSTPLNDKHRAFLSDDEASTVAAIAERIMPGQPGSPGATDADVLNYIDLSLAGAYADQQEFYRQGLIGLEAFCNEKFKDSFVYLKPAQQEEALAAMEAGKATGFTWPAGQAFFNTLRTHTMEGMFSDPVYGGNKDFAGWRLVGFPGAQRLFTTADLKNKGEFTRLPIIGIQSVEKTTGRRK